MEEKILNMIEPSVLSTTVNDCGTDKLFKKYLLEEVFPYMDLTCETVNLKNGLVVSLKDFIEQSVLYTCQNKYAGNFVEFAKDNIISFEVAKAKVQAKKNNGKRFSNINVDFKFSPLAKTYTFFETIDGPKYNVVVDRGKIYFYYKDENFDVIMQNEKDKKDFLKRIKRLDLPYFIKIYSNNPVFSSFVATFKDDEEFYEKLLTGVVKRDAFDAEIDKKIDEITDMINAVESDPHYITGKTDVISSKTQCFDINSIPGFDTDTCLKTIISKCMSYYSEFSSDVDAALESNYVNEKAEYVVGEYLLKIIDKITGDYVGGVSNSVNNDLELDIKEDFLTSELDSIMDALRNNLGRLFVYPYRDKTYDSKDTYIKIICEALENQILFYEQLVNSTIEGMLIKLGYELGEPEPSDTQSTGNGRSVL